MNGEGESRKGEVRRGWRVTYSVRRVGLLPQRRGVEGAALVEGEGLEGALDARMQRRVVEAVAGPAPVAC